MINNGLLLDDVEWVQRGLKTWGEVNSVDDDSFSILQTAVEFGCDPRIIRVLLRAGAAATHSTVERAALTKQPKTLRLLLKKTFLYKPNAFDASKCDDEIQKILKEAEVSEFFNELS